jgi:hypothetical protein
MQVEGGGSTDTVLRWYADRAGGETPPAGVLSLPLWVYRGAMLLWALWLAASLVRAVGPAWRSFSQGGLWRAFPRTLRPPKSPAPDAAGRSTSAPEGTPTPAKEEPPGPAAR